MSRDRRVKDLTAAVQRFRRRVISMLNARGDAYASLQMPTPETLARRAEVYRVARIIGDWR